MARNESSPQGTRARKLGARKSGARKPGARKPGPGLSGVRLIALMCGAEGLAVLPDGVGEIPPGEPVDVMLIDDAPAAEPYRTA